MEVASVHFQKATDALAQAAAHLYRATEAVKAEFGEDSYAYDAVSAAAGDVHSARANLRTAGRFAKDAREERYRARTRRTGRELQAV